MLQPWKAVPGICDGCKTKVHKGDCVMDCRTCNWYLCEACHPQEKEQEDWFWGPLSFFAEATAQEFTDIASEIKEMAGEFETFVSDMAPFAECTAPQVDKGSDMEFPPGKPEKKPQEKKPGVHREKTRSQGQAPEEEKLAAHREKPLNRGQASEEEPAQQEEEVVSKPAAPMEDLMDLGQPDLLDFDQELEFVGKVSDPPSAAQSAAPGSGAALDASTAALPDLLLGDFAPFAAAVPVPAPTPLPTGSAVPPVGFDCQLLDFDAPTASAVSAGKGSTSLLSLAPPPPPAVPVLVK